MSTTMTVPAGVPREFVVVNTAPMGGSSTMSVHCYDLAVSVVAKAPSVMKVYGRGDMGKADTNNDITSLFILG